MRRTPRLSLSVKQIKQQRASGSGNSNHQDLVGFGGGIDVYSSLSYLMKKRVNLICSEQHMLCIKKR